MNNADSPALPLQWVLGSLIAILLSGIAITSMAISPRSATLQENTGTVELAVVSEPAAPPPAERSRICTECGTIESTRRAERAPGNTATEITGDPAPGIAEPESFETTVRMRDGSALLITDADPQRWKRGERVIIMAGMAQ